MEYTYHQRKTDPFNTGKKAKQTSNGYVFRFEPIAEVNDHWTLRARIDATGDLRHDTTTDFNLVRGWAQGDYKIGNNDLQFKFGRQPLYTNEDGIVWDTEYSGAEITFGKMSDGLRATIYGGRLAAGKVGGSMRNSGSWNGRQDGVSAHDRWAEAAGSVGNYTESGLREDPSSFFAINVQYDPGKKGILGGLGYYNIKDDDLKYMGEVDGVKIPNYFYSDKGNTNKAQIWSVNLGYRLGKGQIWGSYAKNTKADYENKSWQLLARYGDLYGGGNQGTHKGQWAVWAGYKYLGSNASFNAIQWDDAYAGTKGFVAGASWAPFDRIVVLAKYFKGKYIEGPGDAERLFGRVEFFF